MGFGTAAAWVIASASARQIGGVGLRAAVASAAGLADASPGGGVGFPVASVTAPSSDGCGPLPAAPLYTGGDGNSTGGVLWLGFGSGTTSSLEQPLEGRKF